MIDILYRALEAKIGLVVHSTDPIRLRTELYKERKKLEDERLKALTFVVRDAEYLYIINQTKRNE